MIAWRFATSADIDEYYGERPDQTIRAIVILLNEKPAGIVGLARRKTDFIAFSEYRPELEPHLKSMTVLRAVKAAQRMFREAPMPVFVCDTTNPKLIERLGFQLIDDGVHKCLN